MTPDPKPIPFYDLTQEQMDCVLEWRNHPQIRREMVRNNPITPEEHHRFCKALKGDAKNYYWLVDGIGVFSIARIQPWHGYGYLGIYANPKSTQKRLGTRLMRLLLEAAFENLGLHALRLEVREDNVRAILLYQRHGFIHEGRLREAFFTGEKRIDLLVMGLLRSTYESTLKYTS